VQQVEDIQEEEGLMQPWTVKQRRYLLQRDWMRLREDHVVLPSGVEMEEFHVVEYPNWAATVCINTDGNLVLAEQYRHGVQRLSLELPAGVIEPGEEPLAAAKRELLEETGYQAPTWLTIGACATDPSNHSNYAYLFLARDAYLSKKQELDAEEEIAVRHHGIDEVLAMIHAGKVIHGIHLTALLWASSKGWLSK
jgi:8-oxo-dGTP pyrophosphatase MutT (NUDIX family)